jgi:hypothetical protein
MNVRKPLLFILLLWGGLISISSNGQIYPVTANLVLIQPNSVYLSDYTTSNADNIRITLLQNDQLNPTYDVKLRLKIEGSGIKIQTSPDFNTVPITLTNGIPEILNGSDMTAYLDPNALQFQGISRDQYRRRAALPDGFYTITVQVFDYRTGIALSEASSTSAWFVLNDPPRLNLPYCGDKLRPQDPTYIMFNWLGMQTGGGFSTEYTFQLFWIQPKGRNPNDLVLAMSNNPMYETTTNSPSIIYGPSEPPLFPGEQYAWRVQAKEAFGRDLFKNNGWSQVCWFTYGDACTPPTDVEATVEGSQRASITWTAAPVITQYKLFYREKGAEKWYSVTTVNEKATITDFKPNTTYEYKVQSVCGVSLSEYTKTDTLRTRSAFANTALSCGQSYNGEKIDSTQKLQTLKAGDEVKVGNFKLIISEASGSNGSFKGRGSMQIALLNTAVMGEFDNLKINNNYEAYAGVVNVKSGAMSLLPPEVRDKVNTYYSQITNVANQIDNGLGNTQAIIDQGTTIVNKIDGIVDQVKTTNLDDLKDKITDIKDIAKDGVTATKDGDTTKGKNLLANAVDKLGDALGATANALSGGADKLRDLVTRLLNEKRTKDSTDRKQTSDELILDDEALVTDISTLQKEYEALITEEPGADPPAYNNSSSEDNLMEEPISEEMLISLKENKYFNSYISRTEKIYLNLDKYMFLEEALKVTISIVQNPDELNNLVNDIKSGLINDLGAEVINDIMNGNTKSAETYAQKYISDKISVKVNSIMESNE